MKYVENKHRRFGSASHYWLVYLSGKPHLFTGAELNAARERADRNPEDVPKPSLWQQFLAMFP